jgi:hypothetical protein
MNAAISKFQRRPNKQASDSAAKILSYAGIFSDMSEPDYADFTDALKVARNNLFNRHVRDLQLITNNTRHFERIEGLNIDNWMQICPS